MPRLKPSEILKALIPETALNSRRLSSAHMRTNYHSPVDGHPPIREDPRQREQLKGCQHALINQLRNIAAT